MDKQREIFVSEIRRLEEAVDKTKSKYLRRDYSRAIQKMKSELAEYDRYKSLSNH